MPNNSNLVSADPLLEISELGKFYPQKPKPILALDGLDLHMAKGEVVSVVGRSGCGKTTLLRIIAGLIKPSYGKVVVGRASPEDFRRNEGISFVFQKPVLFPWRTVNQNLLLVPEIHKGKPTEYDLALADELLNITGLQGFQNAYPRQLSGGMLQRAAFARALMIHPQLLLLDEPLCALDEMTREQLWFDFSRIWTKQDLSILVVTHSIREAVFFGDRILVMSRRPGRIRSTFDIPFRQPRDRDILTSVEFTEFCEKVRGELL